MEQRKVGLVTSVVNPITPGDCAKCTTGGRNGRNKKYFQETLDIPKDVVYYINCKDKHKKALEVKIMIRVQDVTQYQISNLDTSLPILRVRTVYGKTEIYTGNQAIKNLKIIREVFDRIEQELNH